MKPLLPLLCLAVAALLLARPGDAAGSEATVQGLWPRPPDWLDTILPWVARTIEAVGIGVIVLGAVLASAYFFWQLVKFGPSGDIYQIYRANLGRGILLGLEFLIAADIIGTVAIELTLYNLGILAVIVAIRTFLSLALEVEIHGHWPWQHSRIVGEAREQHPNEKDG